MTAIGANSTLVACALRRDRKSTRLNSSHLGISYAVFCLKKKKPSAQWPAREPHAIGRRPHDRPERDDLGPDLAEGSGVSEPRRICFRPPSAQGDLMAPATIDALVTGGTGFVGANVVRELLREGASVRVLARAHGDRRALAGLTVDVCEGDLGDPSSLRRAVQGVRTVYHVAADYRLWVRRPEELYRTNVEGTRAMLQAAADAGVNRGVNTSSVGALGIPRHGSPGTETTPVTLADMVGPYKASKFLAEQGALGFALKGLPGVIVNPSP